MGSLDENSRLQDGTLPVDPEADAAPMEPLGLEGWEEPMAFQDLDVPVFPVRVLPAWLATWCAEQATAIQVPHDLPALLGLAVVSLAIAKKVQVEIKPGWREPTNLYAAVALAPGLGKSPVFAAATAPVRQWERDQLARLAPKIAAAKELAAEREERRRALRKRAASSSSESQRLETANELRELAVLEADEEVPVAPRHLADDATPEAVGRLLAEQRGRLGVFSSEGGPFKILAGRYTDGRANCELFCKAHSGDAYDLDRIGRPSIRLASPLLTIGLTVQPEVISGLAATPEFRSLGLLARFLYAIPRTNLGQRHPDPAPVDPSTRDEYERRVHRLLGLDEERDDHGEIVARAVPLTDEARLALVSFKGRLEPRLGPSGDLAAMADWGNKLPGLAARLAGVLHVAEHGPEGLRTAVDEGTMDRALLVAEYAIAHARAAFGLLVTNRAAALAKVIWTWVLRLGQGAVSKRDVHRAMQARVQSASELDEPLDLLVERGLLREVQLAGPRRAGRPSAMFAVNPRAR